MRLTAEREKEIRELMVITCEDCSPRFTCKHCDAHQDLLAEIDALRAELHNMTECTLGVGNGSGSLFVHGSYEAIKRVQNLIMRDLEK